MLLDQERPARIWSPEFHVAYLPRQAILDHPRYRDARARYLTDIVDLYGHDAFLNRLLMEAARTVIFCVLMVMSAAYDEAQRETWPTLANLKRLTAPFHQSSPRRVEQVVQRLIAVRYLRQETTALDQRLRFLVPTQSFIDHDRDWLAAHYGPLAMLHDGPAYDLALSRSGEFQRAQRKASLAYIPHSVQVLLTNPDVLLFATRDAGFLVQAQLVLDLEAGRSSSFARLGERFHISRTHVRLLLEDAERLGLLILSGRGGAVSGLTPRGWTCLDRFVADAMSGHDLTGGLALQSLGITDPARHQGDEVRLGV